MQSLALISGVIAPTGWVVVPAFGRRVAHSAR
jgi:hypothetical protein